MDRKNEDDDKLEKEPDNEGKPRGERKSFRQRREEVIRQRPIIRKKREHDIQMRRQAELAEHIEQEEKEQVENDLLFREALDKEELSLNMPITSLEQLLLPRKSIDNEQKR